MYGQRMKCPDAIGVVTRRDPFSVIPIEFCRLSQQMYKKVLDPENTNLVLNKATKKPRERFQAIKAARVSFQACSFCANLMYPKAECAGSLPRSGLNAEISTDPIQISARKLPSLGITFGEGRTEGTVCRPSLRGIEVSHVPSRIAASGTWCIRNTINLAMSRSGL